MPLVASSSPLIGWTFAAACVAACSPPGDFVSVLFPNGGKVLDPKLAVVRPWADLDEVLLAKRELLRHGQGRVGFLEGEDVVVSVGTDGPRVGAVTFVVPIVTPDQAYQRLVARWGPPDVAAGPEGPPMWTGPAVSLAFVDQPRPAPLVMTFEVRDAATAQLSFRACAVEHVLRGPPGTDLSWPDGPLLGAERSAFDRRGSERVGFVIEEVVGRARPKGGAASLPPFHGGYEVVGYRARVPDMRCPVSRDRWRELLRARWGEPVVVPEAELQPWGLYAEHAAISVGVVDETLGTVLEVAAPLSWEQFFADFVADFEAEDSADPTDPRCGRSAPYERDAGACWRVIPGGAGLFARLVRVDDVIELRLSPAQADRFEAAAARLIGPRRVLAADLQSPKSRSAAYFDKRGVRWEIWRYGGLEPILRVSRSAPLEALVVFDELISALGVDLTRSIDDTDVVTTTARISMAPWLQCSVSLPGGGPQSDVLRCSGGAFDHEPFGAVSVELRVGAGGSYALSVDVGTELYEAAPGEAHQRLVTRAQELYGGPRVTETGMEFAMPDRAETLRIGQRKGRTEVTWRVAPSPGPGRGE